MKKRKIKAASKDFLPNALPQTRKDQLPFVLKNQFSVLLFSGLWLLLCFLPIILTVFFQNRFEVGFYSMYREGKLSEADYRSSINALMIYGSLLEIAFSFVASIALSGVLRIMKCLLSGESVLFFLDFKEGIKQNYKNTCLLFLFFGILLFLCRFVNAFYFEYFLGIPFYVLLLLLVIPIFLLAGVFSSVYECNVFQAIGNATKLYFPAWWKYLLLALLLAGGLYVLSYLQTIPTFLTTIHLLLALFGLPLYLLLLYSVSFGVFDKYINREQFPSFYGAGLYRPKNDNIDKIEIKGE